MRNTKTDYPKSYRLNNMIFFLIFLLGISLTYPVHAAESEFCRRTDLFPSQIENIQLDKKNKIGSFQFLTHENQLPLNTYFYLPSKHSVDSPIGFLIHDHNRDAKALIAEFAPIAERFNALIVAPEFSKRDFPKTMQFTFGVTNNGSVSDGQFHHSQWKQPYEFLYNELEHLFEGIKQKLNLDACGYFLYGHGAGAQFVQRMLIFSPESRVINAAAANADWYTIPSKGMGKNKNLFIPFGLQGSPIDKQSLTKSFNHKLSILVGEENTSPNDKAINKPALSQGENRYKRAIHFFETAQKQARKLNSPFNWRLAIVPKAEHNSKQISLSAAWYLSHHINQLPCLSSPQTAGKSLFISEILADPDKSLKGDSNHDGIRDAQQDEFIEILNVGKQAVCLTGWQLRNQNNLLHVFPIGTKLFPGKAIVVFGGGIPIGSFGNAIIQQANFSAALKLKRHGDGLFLSDNFGNHVKHLTWGDCGNKKCSAEHIQSDLAIGQSIVRSKKQPTLWQPHSTITPGRHFTPGLRIDGKPY